MKNTKFKGSQKTMIKKYKIKKKIYFTKHRQMIPIVKKKIKLITISTTTLCTVLYSLQPNSPIATYSHK